MSDQGRFDIKTKGPNRFDHSFSFYRRSKFESIDRFGKSFFVRPFLFENDPILIKVRVPEGESQSFQISWQSPNSIGNKSGLRTKLAQMFYADFDLDLFYNMKLDRVMKKLTDQFRGFRPILTPDIFESAAWAIIGQQINLSFAYQVKSRLVELVNRHFEIDGIIYHLFPTVSDIAVLNHDQLRVMKFSSRKAEYLLGLARSIDEGKFDLYGLAELDYQPAMEKLLPIRGIGPWTANYILMRGSAHRDAFPIGDSGLNSAIKKLYKLDGKPTADYLEDISQRWRPYRSLATFYLWKSL